jgi:hypothetical protein
MTSLVFAFYVVGTDNVSASIIVCKCSKLFIHIYHFKIGSFKKKYLGVGMLSMCIQPWSHNVWAAVSALLHCTCSQRMVCCMSISL